jgi:iron complex transport system permease protein
MPAKKLGLTAVPLALLLLLLAMALSAMIYGEIDAHGAGLQWAGPGELWSWLVDSNLEGTIFWRLRLPRIVGAVVVGAGLAGAGCAFQATLRNPLAEPYTLGVSAGAALAAVLAIRFGVDHSFLGVGGVGFAALLGALATVYMVWRIAAVGDRLPPATLLLAGITVAMFCGASTMVVQYTSDVNEIYRMVRWMMGGLDGVLWQPLYFAAPATLLGLLVLLWLARDFNALAAGADAAASLGVNPKRTVTIAFATCALLVGSGIAIAGPIGFVGLIVPHLIRALIGADHRRLIVVSAIAGGATLVLCDLLARTLLFPAELPVGVLTALFGGPFFLALLVREKGSGTLWGG